jgi:hypothetical protein
MSGCHLTPDIAQPSQAPPDAYKPEGQELHLVKRTQNMVPLAYGWWERENEGECHMGQIMDRTQLDSAFADFLTVKDIRLTPPQRRVCDVLFKEMEEDKRIHNFFSLDMMGTTFLLRFIG